MPLVFLGLYFEDSIDEEGFVAICRPSSKNNQTGVVNKMNFVDESELLNSRRLKKTSLVEENKFNKEGALQKCQISWKER